MPRMMVSITPFWKRFDAAAQRFDAPAQRLRKVALLMRKTMLLLALLFSTFSAYAAQPHGIEVRRAVVAPVEEA